MNQDLWIGKLKSKYRFVRLKSVGRLSENGGECEDLPELRNLNVQFRTRYTGYDRTPSFVAYYASKFSLPVFGVTDYASFAGAEELRLACRTTGGVYFCGAEAEVSAASGEKVRALALAVPHGNAKGFHATLAPCRDAKKEYVLAYADKFNSRLKKYGIRIEARDIPSSFGGEKIYTDRLLYGALARAVMEKYSEGEEILAFLEETGAELSEPVRLELSDRANPLYENDLSYALYHGLKVRPPEQKFMPLADFAALCDEYGAICSVVTDGRSPSFLDGIRKEGARSATVGLAGTDAATLTSFYDECLSRGMIPLARTVVDGARKKLNEDFPDAGLSRKYRETVLAVVGHEISTSIRGEDGIFDGIDPTDSAALAEKIRLFSRIGSKGKIL